MLIATVKGDVHDIGKNIVAVVMACNGYEIRDLGVMVEPERIVEEAVAWGAQCICLSGLITPSLDEMARVCEELERRGLRIPVIIGGATTSDLHTAVKIAPVYSGVAVHSANASRNSQILAQLLGPDGDLYADKVKADQQVLREEYARRLRERDLIPIAEARAARRGAAQHEPVVPLHTGRMVFPDWIGCFALTAGIGLKELAEKFRAGGDDYSAIMAKLLADRLTEAFAEAVHAFMRREMWGYETGTPPTPEQAVRGQYRGRRMAFGYPASPDHSLKREVFDLLAVEVTTGMRLTENWMIDPGEALCGLMFSDADYFSVGTIGAEQLLDYARRRGMEAETVKKIIPNNV